MSGAIKEMNIGYPVVMDNKFEIWSSLENQYWPMLYLIDANGKIRYQKFGEGDYRESELQNLAITDSRKNSPALRITGWHFKDHISDGYRRRAS